MFSSRLPASLAQNALAGAVRDARRAGRLQFDLTETNPTASGFSYPEVELAQSLADVGVAEYRPEASGMASARQAIAAAAGGGASPDRLVLASSTSEAYSWLFKILCDAGDEVLVPRPSYPLFDLLTGLESVRPVHYLLDATGGWCIDRESLERALTPSARAVLVVSPNNPTGSRIGVDDREWLVDLASRHRLAIISDEVFADYPLVPRRGSTSFAGERRVLTFTLGGLSKSAGLPQMKLAWIDVSGPAPLAEEAMARLEIVADSYLSVSTAVQLATPRLIEVGKQIRAAVQERLTRNLTTLRAMVERVPALTLHEPEGGWSAVLRVPAVRPEEDMVLMLLEKQSVLVHPGYFFDFDAEAYLVLSLLPEPRVFDEGTSRLARSVEEDFR